MINTILTIDDISSKNTIAIVDYLNSLGIKALLFGVGEYIEKNYTEAQYVLKKGMILGNHSYSHPHFSTLSLNECIEEIQRNEEVLNKLYESVGIQKTYRPFRFPFGDKGGSNYEDIQKYLKENGFNKLDDSRITYPYWKENRLDKDIDTYWTYDVEEYRVRPNSDFCREDVLKKIDEFDFNDGNQIILLHAHDETEAMWNDYYKEIIDRLLQKNINFIEPKFL